MNSRILVLATGLVCLHWNVIVWGAEEVPWYARCLVGMEVGPTGAQFGSDRQDTTYAMLFDGREIVRRCAAAHCEYVVIWGRDGEYTYYKSDLESKAPGLGERDVLRETVEEAGRHRMPVIVYCVLQYPSQVLREHPDWKARDKDGQPINHLVCFNSPYLEHVKKLLSEMLAYGIDGFHLDMVDQGFGPPHGCWCNRCQALFQKDYGQPMPKGVTWDEAWDHMLEFRYNTSDRFERELTAHVRGKTPKATVDFNYHGNPPFSWEVGQRPVQHADNSDFVTGETGVWGFSALGVGLNAEFYRSTTPGHRYQVAMQRGVRMYHDQTTRPLQDIRWELFTLLAHGAFVTMVDKTAFDGWLDPVGYDRTGAAFGEALDQREHFGHTPVCEVGLYYSTRSRDWIGRDQPLRWMQSFLGAHKALVYSHIPYGVLHEENLSLEGLQTFPIVLLPNAGILAPEQVSLFRRYVEQGGNLIITGQTGFFDARGKPLSNGALAELTGANLKKPLDWIDNWVRFNSSTGNKAIRGQIRSDWPFLVKGPAAIWEPTTARPIAELMKPHRSLRQQQGQESTEWPMSADQPVGPAILVNSVGQGRVLTFPCSPDYAAASEHHVAEARQLLANAVHYLRPNPPIRITAPVNVEAIVTDDPDARLLRVHLLGYFAPPQTTPEKNRPYVLPALLEDPPLYRASIEVDRRLKNAKALHKSTELQRHGRRVDVTVNDLHEIILLRY